jgi:two-component system chemotaxis response regulator CheY
MKKTVLIVDDFENTRWVVEFAIKSLNVEVLTASNGSEALKFFDGRKIDLLITDLNMPVMDGVELVRNIRNLDNYSFIPIVMLSTERNIEKMKKAQEVKVTAWIQKPYKQEDFLKIVQKLLK